MFSIKTTFATIDDCEFIKLSIIHNDEIIGNKLLTIICNEDDTFTFGEHGHKYSSKELEIFINDIKHNRCNTYLFDCINQDDDDVIDGFVYYEHDVLMLMTKHGRNRLSIPMNISSCKKQIISDLENMQCVIDDVLEKYMESKINLEKEFLSEYDFLHQDEKK